MVHIQEKVLQQIKDHAAAEYPRECCGILGDDDLGQVYIPCRNISEKDDQFGIHPEDLSATEDTLDIKAIVHSHPDESAHPSEVDKIECEKSGLPWVIIGWPSEVVIQVSPTGYKPPLLGREFHHGVLDCFSLVKDALAEYCNILLPEFKREDLWWEKGQNLYLDHYKQAGFIKVYDIKKYDVVLMQVVSKVPNHAAVYIGDNKILHHLVNRLSTIDVYGGYWQKHTVGIYRHQELV